MRTRKSVFLVGLLLVVMFTAFSLNKWFLSTEAHPIVGFRSTHGSVTLTIYQNQDLALVEDERVLELLRGVYELPVQGVSDYLIPSSFRLELPEDPDAVSLDEFRFLGRPLSQDRMLNDLLGQEIEVFADGGMGTYRGRLLSTRDGILLEDANGVVHLIKDATRFSLPTPNFIEPTMLWRLRSTLQGPQIVDFRYLTTHIDWAVEYSATIDEAEENVSFDSWVTIYNNAGLEFTLPKVRLIAGDLNRASMPFADDVSFEERAQASAPQAGGGVTTQQAFEYFEYTIPNPTTIHSGETTQINFLEYASRPVEKRYVYEPQMSNGVQVWFKFVNDGEDATPLPAGLVRLYQLQEERARFIGEDRIDRAPVDEEVNLLTGRAFDLIGERVLVNQDRTQDVQNRVFTDTYRISLTNRKAEPVTIFVIEHLPGDWEILSATAEYSMLDNSRIEFEVMLEPDETRDIEYTVEYHY